MDKGDTGAVVASPMGRSVGAKAPTGKDAEKKASAGKKGKTGVNNCAEEVGKVVGEVNTPKEKQKYSRKTASKLKTMTSNWRGKSPYRKSRLAWPARRLSPARRRGRRRSPAQAVEWRKPATRTPTKKRA
jgi:hypothetical protein